jgi:bifunctional non-homologous end joining protein LigD
VGAFPANRRGCRALKVRSFLMDGEAVACDGDGLPVFERLRYRRQDARVFLYAFDLLELNGLDLRREPLELRRRPRKLTPHQRQEALRRLHAGETIG